MKKTMKPYSLKFVNNGNSFDVPNWSPEKHEAALAKLAADTKDMTDAEQEKQFKYYVVHETLSEIDETGDCTLEKVKAMHPIDIIDMFKVVYNAGREGIYSADFRKELETRALRKLKSIGKKSSKSSKN